ncbi:MAG: GTPase ObgE [Patescibacteria group bacterium]
MLIDDITIKVAAGDGGRGAVSFNKNKESLGPTGGSGGNGGSVYCQGVFDIGALRQFRFKKELVAENGENGKSQFNDGRTGTDLILKVPIGTVIRNLDNESIQEIIDAKEPLLLAQGGHGGKGNFLFRSSRNTTPKQFQKGLPGDKFTIRFELKLIADVGFVGFPNAGKSSLLNELTSANIKVANYPFTTLEPNLGAYYELILADIPGLIEGASTGKGLGIKFLRHVERTKILFHFISAESEEPGKDWRVIREELGAYSPELLNKKEYLFLSKSDTTSPANIQKKLVILKKLNPSAIPISIYDADSMAQVKKILNEISKAKIAPK